MPVNVTKEGETNRFSGAATVIPEMVSDKVFEGKDGMPNALRVVCRIKGTEDNVSLFIPLAESAVRKLQPFIPDVESVPTTEAGMRDFLASNLPNQEFLVYVNNGSVRSRIAGPGKHLATFRRLFTYENAKGETRARIILRTKDYAEITWTTPWTGAAEADASKNDVSINVNKSAIGYLVKLGLDVERLVKELQAAEKKNQLFPYWDDEAGVEIGGFFAGDEPKDVTRALTEAVKRHGASWVQVEVVDNKQWGPGPKRSGQFKEVELERVVVDDAGKSADQVAFDKELEYLYEMYENLTKVVQGTEARFMARNNLTSDGLVIAQAVIKPVMLACPQFLKTEGVVQWPPKLEDWHVDGLVVCGMVAQKLIQAGEETRAKLINKDLAAEDHTPLIEWVRENVQEFSAQPMEEALPL